MARYPAGSPVRVSTEVRDTAGVLTTPGTILLRVRKPDGTFIADYTTPVADSTGKYHQDIPAASLTDLGPYQYAWITTGTAAGVSRPATFQVIDPFGPTHLSFDDVKARLNVSSLSDAEIEDMMASAVSEQENSVGPVAPRSVTRTVSPSSGVLLLPTPVISITSITPAGGSPLSLVGLDLSGLSAGIVRPGSSAYWWSATSYAVVYVAGRNPVPQDLVEAALLRVQHSYATQRGGSAGASRIIGGAVDDVSAGPDGSDFLLMLRALDKEKPYVMPAVA